MAPSRGVLFAALVLALAAPSSALAQTASAAGSGESGDDKDDENKPDDGTYVSVAFLGGALLPLGDMADTHQPGLAAGIRLGFTSRHGIGLDVEAEYSPLSRKELVDGESFETHFATAALMPRFTLGNKSKIRGWVSAGAGVAYERTTLTVGDDRSSESKFAPVGVGAIGVELFPVAGAGLAITSRFSRAFGDVKHQFVDIGGGLVFTF